jgi:hypothetical protein
LSPLSNPIDVGLISITDKPNTKEDYMNRWTTLLMSGLVAAALTVPAMAQTPANGTAQNVGERKEQQGKADQKKGERLEKKGAAQGKKGEKLETAGHPNAGEKLEKKGAHNEKRGEHLEKKGARLQKQGEKIEDKTKTTDKK